MGSKGVFKGGTKEDSMGVSKRGSKGNVLPDVAKSCQRGFKGLLGATRRSMAFQGGPTHFKG